MALKIWGMGVLLNIDIEKAVLDLVDLVFDFEKVIKSISILFL